MLPSSCRTRFRGRTPSRYHQHPSSPNSSSSHPPLAKLNASTKSLWPPAAAKPTGVRPRTTMNNLVVADHGAEPICEGACRAERLANCTLSLEDEVDITSMVQDLLPYPC